MAQADKKKQTKYAKIVTSGAFKVADHYYPKVQGADLSPVVSTFLNMDNDRIIARYCLLNPNVNVEVLKRVLNYKPKYLAWSGADLLYATATDNKGIRDMILIELNSCPSGQKSMPKMGDPFGGYRKLIEHTFLPKVREAENDRRLPAGGLAVVWDKNFMEASGYAATIAEFSNEPVYLTEFLNEDPNPPVKFIDQVMHVRTQDEKWVPIRACFRYVTQVPWNRIPMHSKTLVHNPISACLAGGRNKLVASKAYDSFNEAVIASGLKIMTPSTIRDVRRDEVAPLVKSFGYFAVIKNPYSNCGQGVWTITSEQELNEFMEENQTYTEFLVQSLVGHPKWASANRFSQYCHVGMMPNEKGEVFVADLRMMVNYDYQAGAYRPLVMYARRTAQPLSADRKSAPSWNMLGTNMSIKKEGGEWDTETDRLVVMDVNGFYTMGIGIDQLISAYIQTVMATVAIDKLSQEIQPNGHFDMKLFSFLNNDPVLLKEILLGDLPKKSNL
eukprot:TRINITY_DN8884_c0_g1_i1.p1 TRINITY_DN8884_c0_g1~~TRINITY_DN8884_c0_g1_i1.p1  ORF type:complete len:500 (-),score=95.81 TRINITY_DN8884_c0_g1_i1:9-1508(-)